MDPDVLRTGLARFAADLTFAGEPIAFDAVVERHIGLLIGAQAAKLRWPSIARMLALAGACRADGKAISADQLRASVSRVKRRIEMERATSGPSIARLPTCHTAAAVWAGSPRPQQNAAPSSGGERSAASPDDCSNTGVDADLSAAELNAARRRLR